MYSFLGTPSFGTIAFRTLSFTLSFRAAFTQRIVWVTDRTLWTGTVWTDTLSVWASRVSLEEIAVAWPLSPKTR